MSFGFNFFCFFLKNQRLGLSDHKATLEMTKSIIYKEPRQLTKIARSVHLSYCWDDEISPSFLLYNCSMFSCVRSLLKLE